MSALRPFAAVLLALGLSGPASAQATLAAVTAPEPGGCTATLPAGRVVIDRLDEELAIVVSTDGGAARCVRRFAIAATAQREGAVLTDGRPDASAEAALRASIAHTRARLQGSGDGGAPW